MKRIFARLSSFLLILIIIAAVLCNTSANFPSIYRIIGVKGVCSENGDWVLYTNRTENGTDNAVFTLSHSGKLITAIATPFGFLLCISMYFVLLFLGRKRISPQKRDFSAAYNKFYCESDDDASDCETGISEADTLLSTSSYE